MKKIVDVLLIASDDQMDASMKPLIKKWSEPPEPIQVLEVIDLCIHGGLASSIVVHTLQILYDMLCKSNNTTHDEVVKLAIWCNEI